MYRQIAWVAVMAFGFAGAASAQDADSVAGRPMLSTKSTGDLISQREQWGTAPSAAKATSAAATAAGAAAAGYAVLPTGDLSKLIAEREGWGKGPAGYEKKKVSAPRAAGTGKAVKVKKAKKTAVKKVVRKKKKKN